ncbi:hypothetical protein F511_05705 [Dorcoceras hygrometricum]|uniref:Uncharacterized protein n=1 Tax=Dorcoceras hygrometricum TaxID=472368 RepID=A0A2Z7B7W1_9LAMI|nr:hypothetical protein F511_05705 [Dorcoceras hygrometricum]
MPPLPPRDPRTKQHAPDPEDSCSDREVARGLRIIEDHGEDLAPKITENISSEISDESRSIVLHLQAIPTIEVPSSLGGGNSSAEIIRLHHNRH